MLISCCTTTMMRSIATHAQWCDVSLSPSPISFGATRSAASTWGRYHNTQPSHYRQMDAQVYLGFIDDEVSSCTITHVNIFYRSSYIAEGRCGSVLHQSGWSPCMSTSIHTSLTTHHLPLITYHSSLTTHHLPHSTHHQSTHNMQLIHYIFSTIYLF